MEVKKKSKAGVLVAVVLLMFVSFIIGVGTGNSMKEGPQAADSTQASTADADAENQKLFTDCVNTQVLPVERLAATNGNSDAARVALDTCKATYGIK